MLYPESLVWLPDERCLGNIIGPMGAYYSTILYIRDGIEREVLMENEDFILLEDSEDWVVEYDAD